MSLLSFMLIIWNNEKLVKYAIASIQPSYLRKACTDVKKVSPASESILHNPGLAEPNSKAIDLLSIRFAERHLKLCSAPILFRLRDRRRRYRNNGALRLTSFRYGLSRVEVWKYCRWSGHLNAWLNMYRFGNILRWVYIYQQVKTICEFSKAEISMRTLTSISSAFSPRKLRIISGTEM